MLVGTAAIFVSGVLYMLAARPYDTGRAPAGDAHRLHRRTSA
jgi:hypothetical protein